MSESSKSTIPPATRLFPPRGEFPEVGAPALYPDHAPTNILQQLTEHDGDRDGLLEERRQDASVEEEQAFTSELAQSRPHADAVKHLKRRPRTLILRHMQVGRQHR